MIRLSRGGSRRRDEKVPFCSTRLIANPQSKLRLTFWRMLPWGLWWLPTIAYYLLKCAEWTTRCEGTNLGLLPVAYHLLTVCVCFAYSLLTSCLHVQNGQRDVREPIWGCWRVPTIGLPCAFVLLIVCLLATYMCRVDNEMSGSQFGIAGGCQPFAFHVAYGLLM